MAILQKADSQDREAQAQFEATIQKYLEATRIQQLQQMNQPNKNVVESAKKVLSLAGPLMTDYFENEQFSAKLNEWYGEEFKVISMLKSLAKDIVQEAK